MNIQNLPEYAYPGLIYNFLIRTTSGAAFSVTEAWKYHKDYYPAEPIEFIRNYIQYRLRHYKGIESIEITIFYSRRQITRWILYEFKQRTLQGDPLLMLPKLARIVYGRDELSPEDGEIKSKKPEPDPV